MISNKISAFNTPISSEPTSIVNFISSPEEAGPTILDETVSQSVLNSNVSSLSKEVGPTLSQKIGSTLLQGTISAFDTTPSVSLFESMSLNIDTVQSVFDDINTWSYLPLPYDHASKLIKP